MDAEGRQPSSFLAQHHAGERRNLARKETRSLRVREPRVAGDVADGDCLAAPVRVKQCRTKGGDWTSAGKWHDTVVIRSNDDAELTTRTAGSLSSQGSNDMASEPGF